VVSWTTAGGVDGVLAPDGDDAFEPDEQDVAAIVIRTIPAVTNGFGRTIMGKALAPAVNRQVSAR
jgi:hypothetical protein